MGIYRQGFNDSRKKKTISGLMDKQHEVRRLENIFIKRVDSSYYLRDFGMDWDFYDSDKTELPVDAMLNHLTRKSTAYGIMIKDVQKSVEDFTLNLEFTLLSEEKAYITRR